MKTAAELFEEAFEVELHEGVRDGPPLDQWSVAAKGKTKSLPNGEDATWWRANGPAMVQAWIDWRKRSKWLVWTTPDGQPAIELDIVVDDMPGSDAPLKMFIDRIMVMPRGSLAVVDLKTGSRTPESDLQLGVYRYGVWRKYGVQVDRGGYWMARKGEVTEPFNLRRYTPALIERWFQGFQTARENKIFLPHPTNMCRACGMRDFCAAYGGRKSHLDPDFVREEQP